MKSCFVKLFVEIIDPLAVTVADAVSAAMQNQAERTFIAVKNPGLFVNISLRKNEMG